MPRSSLSWSQLERRVWRRLCNNIKKKKVRIRSIRTKPATREELLGYTIRTTQSGNKSYEIVITHQIFAEAVATLAEEVAHVERDAFTESKMHDEHWKTEFIRWQKILERWILEITTELCGTPIMLFVALGN